MGALLQLAVSLVSVDCGECGGTYAINQRYHEQCRTKGTAWNCPYCKTGWGFIGNGENDKLKKQLAEEQQRKADALARANTAEAEKHRLENRLKRVKNGVCPCCTRSFAQLAAHMKRKHPEYLESK